jgi:hypothetical protein
MKSHEHHLKFQADIDVFYIKKIKRVNPKLRCSGSIFSGDVFNWQSIFTVYVHTYMEEL